MKPVELHKPKQAWDNFIALTKQVLSAPKDDLDKRAAKYEREKRKRAEKRKAAR